MNVMSRMGPSLFYSSDRVRATSIPGTGKRLVVSFTGIGKPDTREQAEEFVGTSHMGGQNHVLFVADTLRSWYNASGTYEEILDLVDSYRRLHGIEETVTFGNSMGGYGAIIFAGPLEAKRCLSFSAQYSADPSVVPEEKRWTNYREAIPHFTRPPMQDTISDDCLYFVVHGGSNLEKPHWSRFPRGGNFHHYLADNVGHALGKKMKVSGMIKPITHYAIVGRPVAFRRALRKVFSNLRRVEKN